MYNEKSVYSDLDLLKQIFRQIFKNLLAAKNMGRGGGGGGLGARSTFSGDHPHSVTLLGPLYKVN